MTDIVFDIDSPLLDSGQTFCDRSEFVQRHQIVEPELESMAFNLLLADGGVVVL